MNKLSRNQKGFSAVILVILIMVVVALISAGYFIFSRQNSTSTKLDVKSAQASVPVAPEIKTKEDITKTESTLDTINLDDNTDLDLLEKELNNF